MNEDVAREMLEAVKEVAGLARDALESATAANLMTGALAGAMFKIAPDSRADVERALQKALSDAAESGNSLSEKAAKRALQVIGADPA